MSLLELQRRMARDVMRPLTDEFAMQPVSDAGISTGEIASGYIKPNGLLTSFERLEIYNRQYWFRVIAAVAEDFPALNAVLGQKTFDSLVLAYLRKHPSTTFSLRNLGVALPSFLQSGLAWWPATGGAQHALAVDVARLEWAYVEAFDGAGSRPLDWRDLSTLGPGSTLSLQPHLQLLDLQFPVDELVLAVRRMTPAAGIVSNAAGERRQTNQFVVPAMKRESIYLAVHRFDDMVYYRRIESPEFTLLASLQQGDSIALAIQHAFTGSRLAPEQQATRIQECFSLAAELGWFC